VGTIGNPQKKNIFDCSIVLVMGINQYNRIYHVGTIRR